MSMTSTDSNLQIYIYINLLSALPVHIHSEYWWSGHVCWKFFYGNTLFKIDEKIIPEVDSYVSFFFTGLWFDITWDINYFLKH